jgi:hypothetical protein
VPAGLVVLLELEPPGAGPLVGPPPVPVPPPVELPPRLPVVPLEAPALLEVPAAAPLLDDDPGPTGALVEPERPGRLPAAARDEAAVAGWPAWSPLLPPSAAAALRTSSGPPLTSYPADWTAIQATLATPPTAATQATAAPAMARRKPRGTRP